MRFLKIGLTKLKIVLTEAECKAYGIDSDTPEKSKIKAALADIMEKSKDEVGFDIGKDKVLVQLYPTESGGEVFITKLTYLTKNEESEVLRADNVTSCERVECVFKFANFECLYRAAYAVNTVGVKSSLYYGLGSYYLTVSESAVNGISSLLPLYEFGERVSEVPYEAWLEGGRLLVSETGLECLRAL